MERDVIMKIAEWLGALSYLYKLLLDSGVDYPVWKIEQVTECFTEEEKNEAILFYLNDANLDDYADSNKQRFITQWVCKADCFNVRKTAKTALEYLEIYGLSEMPDKLNMTPEDVVERHKHCVDMRFNDCFMQTIEDVYEAANRDFLKRVGLVKYIHIYPKPPNKKERQRIKRKLDDEYLLKRGLNQVPQILHKNPGAIVKKHKAEVQRRLTERTAEINGLMDGAKRKYLSIYMEAQIEREVSNMVRKESGTENTVEQARANYKPEKIKCLLIAEAPPDSIDRFFYFEKVEKADYLFLGIMEVLNEERKNEYLEKCRPPEMKKKMLEKFKKQGFFLLDLLELPSHHYNNLKQARAHAVPGLIDRIDEVINKNTPIILIKATVYKALFGILRDKGYKVIEVPIPFPSNGWQTQFREKFSKALHEARLGMFNG